MTTFFMFPGQSSRYAGMLDKLVELHRSNAEILEHASTILGRDLGAHYRKDNEQAFARNTDVQVGVFLANHMFMKILTDAGIEADLSAGLSLGEWNHLVHIGALCFEDALMAVEQRGAAYDAGPRGAMASIFPLELDALQTALTKVEGDVEIVNLNSPRQNVISGETAAVEAALKVIDDEYYVEGVIIERQVPMHSSRFAPVGAQFRKHLEGIDFQKPRLPYLPNRLAEFVEAPTKEAFVNLLATHVHAPVFWRKSIDLLIESYPDVVLVEVGPKSVLYNLIGRKWHKEIKRFRCDTAENTASNIEALIDELGQRVAPLSSSSQRIRAVGAM